tara:strand:- start:730 stop:1104 length:375 start_codon:yes stop_codon:yes gene_type:complete
MATSLITDNGLNAAVSKWLNVGSTTNMTHLSVGSGETTPLVTDTDMQTQIVRVAPDTKTVADNVITLEHYYGTTEGNGTIREVGVLSASSGGVLHMHGQPAAAITKTTNKTMRVTVTITLDNKT